MVTSNHMRAVPLEPGDRRSTVIEVSDAEKQNTAYFGRLRDIWALGGREAFLEHLLALDLTGFDPRNPLDTDEKLGELAEIVGGSTPSTKTAEYWRDGHHIWATPKDLSKLDSLFLFDTERRITDAGLAKVGSGLSPVGTVLLSSRAPIGYLAIADAPAAVNQGFIAIRPSSDFPTSMALLWCRANMDRIKASANGSTFQEISKRNFRPLMVVRSSAEVTNAFDGIVAPMFELIRRRSFETHTLAATRDLLLPRLMSGEIRVGDAEAELEAAQ